MSEKTTSQAQQKKTGLGFDPEALFGTDVWRRAADEGMTRMAQWMDEAAKLERTSWDHASRAVDQSAKLAQESIAYAGQLTAEWRKLSLDAMRRTMDLTGPRG